MPSTGGSIMTILTANGPQCRQAPAGLRSPAPGKLQLGSGRMPSTFRDAVNRSKTQLMHTGEMADRLLGMGIWPVKSSR